MAWLEKATLDLTNAQFEPNVKIIVEDFVKENMWNTPFIIKTGTMKDNPDVTNTVSTVLDRMMIHHTIWDYNQIEVVEV
jgi:hypothetical protein